MARATNSELETRIAQLEAENAALREHPAETRPTGDEPPTPPRGRSWGWTVLSTALVVIGVLLAPVAIVATWTETELTDTDRFVATFSPLADEPAVQDFVTEQTMAVIGETVDVEQLTSDLVDGITELGTGPRATEALNALKGPAAAGILSLIESRIAAFVASDAFADVWATALRVTHHQLVAAMANDPDSAVVLGGDGTIGVQLGPVVDAAKDALVAQGIGFAAQIPTIDRTVTVAQSDALPALQLGYGAAVAAGIWLPWIALAFLAGGVVVARRRSVALVVASLALALVMALVLVGFAVGRALFVTSVSPSLIPTGVSTGLFDTVTGAMRETGVAVLVLGIVVALVAWLAGPFDTPRRLRALAGTVTLRARRFGEAHGVTTGRAGVWIYEQRTLLRAGVAVLAAVVLVFGRPITPPLIVWTLVGAVLVIALLEFVQRPPALVVVEQYDEPPLTV